MNTNQIIEKAIGHINAGQQGDAAEMVVDLAARLGTGFNLRMAIAYIVKAQGLQTLTHSDVSLLARAKSEAIKMLEALKV